MSHKLAVILFFLPAMALGQADTADFSLIPKGEYFKSYIDDSKHIITSPGRFDRNDWLTAAGTVAGGALLFTRDQAINRFWKNNSAYWADQAIRYGLEPFGRGIYPAVITGGLYIHGTVTRNAYNRNVALTTAKAVIISGILTQVTKQLFHRHRPSQVHPGKWEGPFAPAKYNAFPSGHSCMAFTFASVIAHAYRDITWLPLTAYTVATLSSAARVYSNNHWASDVFFGSMMGFFVGRSIWRLNRDGEKIHLGMTPSGIGLCVPIHR